MIRSRHRPVLRDWIGKALATGIFVAFPLAAETATNINAPHQLFPAAAILLPPALPHVKSPVDSFRELLAMTATERETALTNRPPAVRARILAKVREYAALDPNERALRLRATELRWYLLPLLLESPTNRAAQLAAVPDDLQPLVNSRLQQWDILPPTLQAEFFESQHALRYFTHVDSSSSPPGPPMPPGWHPGPHDSDLTHWDAFSGDQRQTLTARVNQFFELTPAEKQKTLNTLSDAERQQMEKTLEMFGQLPRAQRQQCLRAFTEFAGMTAQEKQDFLKNAQRWSQMSPKERQAWRDLVAHVPEWPPMPPQLMPPMPLPPQLSQRVNPVVATNPN
jgi:hypothetical protein